MEVGVQLTDVRYTITNFGVDVGDKGEVRYFPQGPHDLGSITWAPSGKPVRLPAGTYNVRVTFTDGDAHKEIWFDNQSFSGKVDKTVEVGVRITDVRYIITNGGVDVGDKGQVHYFPPGPHDRTRSPGPARGKTVRLPEGTYNVHVTFDDGDAHKEMWLDNQTFCRQGREDRRDRRPDHRGALRHHQRRRRHRGQGPGPLLPGRPARQRDHLGQLGRQPCGCRRATTTSR